MKTKIIIIFLVTLSSFVVNAQQDSLKKKNDLKIWMNIGLITSLDENINTLAGVNTGINACFNNRHYIFLRAGKMFENQIGFHGFEIKERSLNNLSTYVLMYGTGENYSTKFSIIYYAGISYNKGNWVAKQTGNNYLLLWEIPEYKIDQFTSVGVPLNISFLWKKEHYAFSIDLYANFHKHSDFGIVLNNHFGKIGGNKKSHLQ